MKTSLKTIISVISLSCFMVPLSFAEGNGNADWAEKAALEYQKKAEEAAAAGNAEAARIFNRMAQIKRDAGAASKEGKEFSWKEYQELQGKLHHAMGRGDHDHKEHAHKEHAHKEHDKKPDNGPLQAAKIYDIKAAMARELGNESDAKIYTRLAAIKRSSAAGELKNWDEYHELSAQLSDHEKHHDNDGAKKDHKDKPDNGFLAAAADYEMKATKAMEAGNEHNARIFTKMSNMKKEAAAAAAEGKGYDWTEYFALQKELK